jgi:hypothetical protein
MKLHMREKKGGQSELIDFDLMRAPTLCAVKIDPTPVLAIALYALERKQGGSLTPAIEF